MMPLVIIAATALCVATDDPRVVYGILNAVVCVMAARLAGRGRSPVQSALWWIVFAWFFTDAILSFAGATMEDDLPLYAPMAGFFTVWAIKTALLRTLASDPLDNGRYMYALGPACGPVGTACLLRLSSLSMHGSRAVIAGDWLYCAHKGVFRKLRLSLVDLSGYTLINSGEPLNVYTSTRLDSTVGEQCVPLLRDCSSLGCDRSLEAVIFRRGMGWIRTNFLRLFRP